VTQSNVQWDDYWRLAAAQNRDADPTGTDITAPFFIEAGPKPDKTNYVMDLGCGSGVLSHILRSSNYVNSRFIGVDLSLDAAHMTVKKTQGLAVQADLSKLPVANHSVDWVVSQFALEYAPSQAWQEAARVVRPGGQLTVVVHAVGSLIHQEHERALANFIALDHLVDMAFSADERGEIPGVLDPNTLRQVRATLEVITDRETTRLAKPMTAAFLDCINRVLNLKDKHSMDGLSLLAQWLEHYQLYRQRIESMIAAALHPTDFMNIQQGLVSSGFMIQTAGFMTVPSGAKLGFKLSAYNNNAS
jgi:SAM-dependent methyltransferase